jgi:hypothetical protein
VKLSEITSLGHFCTQIPWARQQESPQPRAVSYTWRFGGQGSSVLASNTAMVIRRVIECLHEPICTSFQFSEGVWGSPVSVARAVATSVSVARTYVVVALPVSPALSVWPA